MINSDLNLVVITTESLKGALPPSYKLLPQPSRFDSGHFCGHIMEAAHILGIPVCGLSATAFLDIMSSAHYSIAVQKLKLIVPAGSLRDEIARHGAQHLGVEL